MSEYIEKLTEAIEAVHECRCSHFGSEHIKEEIDGQVVFEGNVEIFQIEGNDQANVAYGWGWEGDSGEIDYIGILHVPPIESAKEAVKAAIASGKF